MQETQQQSEFDPASTDAEFDAAVANRPNQHADQDEWVQYTQNILDILQFTNELYENDDEYAQGIDGILERIGAKYRPARKGEISPTRSADGDDEMSGGEGGGGEGDDDDEDKPEDRSDSDEEDDGEGDENDNSDDDLDSVYLDGSSTLECIKMMETLVKRKLNQWVRGDENVRFNDLCEMHTKFQYNERTWSTQVDQQFISHFSRLVSEHNKEVL